ncbi:MAG: radical SAM protein [Alphaproteobacteria bacterium]
MTQKFRTEAKTVSRPRCHLPWQEMIIQANGAVEPCCYWTAHGNANPPLGNINESSVEEIWNGEGYRRLRANMAAGNLAAAGCANCFALKQGQALALEYDEDCERPEHRDTPYAKNIRILKDEVSRGEEELTAKPTILSVTISHKCNLACLHCYQNSSRDRHWRREEAWEEVSALIPTMVRLIAGGGEPLLLSHWRRFIGEFNPAKAPLLNFAMTTNATVVKREVLEGLKRFKSLHIIVSLDGANARVYDKIRVNGSFAEVEKNIRILQDAVGARPKTAVTTFGLCMSVMKSNIRHLPEFVRWAAEQGLLFSIHPVLSLPLSESLVAFNDPARDMDGWREALDEAREILRTVDTPALPELWRAVQRLEGRQSRHAWPFFQALDDFIPWDVGFTKHYRACLPVPGEALAKAKQQWPRQNIVVVWSAVERGLDGDPLPYFAPIRDGHFDVRLPMGDHPCYLAPDDSGLVAPEIASTLSHDDKNRLTVPIGLCHVTPSGAALVQEPSHYGKILGSLLGRGKAGPRPAITAEFPVLASAPLS